MKLYLILLLLSIIFLTGIINYKNNIENFEDIKYNLVIITSVIYTSEKPLRSNLDSYIHSRSTVSHADRFTQTLKTIETVKEKIPNCHIVLIEGSKLKKEDIKQIYAKGCNYIYDESDELKDVINSDSKSLAEAMMLLHFLNSKYFLNNKYKFETYSKISGRYYLTDNFDFNKYELDKVVCQCSNINLCNTRYYRIPMKKINKYINILNEFINDPDLLNYKVDIEHYNIFKSFKNKYIIYPSEKLGVAGILGPWNKSVEDFIQ
jgi:hypothetical protein